MKCGRPKWMLRQLFQVFFLSVLSILIVVAVLAYLLYSLPAYPPVGGLISSYQKPSQQQYQHQRTLEHGSAIIKLSPFETGDRIAGGKRNQDLNLIPLETAPVRHVSRSRIDERKHHNHREDWQYLPHHLDGSYRTKCSMFACFDIHRCGGGGYFSTNGAVSNTSFSIYIYPIYQWVVDGRKLQSSMSREFYQYLQWIKQSPYYVNDPNKACIFVPSIDLLNLNRLSVSSEDLLLVLSSLEFWGSAGQNHVLFTMFPGNSPILQLKTNAIIASSGLFVKNYRLGFHIPVITPSPNLLFSRSYRTNVSNQSAISIVNGGIPREQLRVRNPQWIAVAVLQGSVMFHDLLNSANHDNSILLLDYCQNTSENEREPIQLVEPNKQQYNHNGHKLPYSIRCVTSTHNRGVVSEQFQYPDILKEFDFCLVVRDLANPVLWEVMSVGCIPVIIADHQRLPFDEFIDWRRISIQIYEHQTNQLSSIIGGISENRRRQLRAQVRFIFEKYFQDMTAISSTLMKAINARVFSHFTDGIQQWNDNRYFPYSNNIQSPLFNPVTALKESGFTAVILAYERVTSLFTVIQRVAQVPSLVKILVVWNNQLKDPPTLDSWPKVDVPVKIVKANGNKMSNRFVPYDEIETEAIFSVDDDIVMLTVDEIEFGYETWREFPDRIVGFPSRSHVWDNTTHRWKYESEWTSEISMVLTGAAFYHKYWHFAYTNELHRDIREWVDSKMNCEDIAMNFLVAARTGKSPIKVTPRKKFKCPTCNNNEMLSTDSGHMVVRTDCINKFAQIMGFMPLISAEFRADPVLYKVDGIPKQLRRFTDMGTM